MPTLALVTGFLSLCAVLVVPVAAEVAPGWHPHDDIRATATQFVKDLADGQEDRTTIRAKELDTRLRLSLCDTDLEAYLPAGGRVGANTTVGVRCRSPRPWKLFVPVKVSVSASILVAARALERGATLGDKDWVAASRDVSRLHGGYLRAGEAVTGMVLRRDVQAGEPLRNNLLAAAKLVRRGQQVTIEAAGGRVRIRMAGTALADGRRGQRIKVKNLNSGRIVEGLVRSSERVEIGLE